MPTKNFNLAKLARNINIEDDGSIAFTSQVSAGGETIGSLTASMDSDQTSTITLSKASTPVPIVQAYKEIPQTGLSSKGQWDVNANATNYDFYDEKPISYSSANLTPSATGDGTFTNSAPNTTYYDVANATYDNISNAQYTAFTGAYSTIFNNNGTKAYVTAHNSSGDIYQYSLSTAYDVSTNTYDSKTYAFSEFTYPTASRFNGDGTKLYTVAWNGSASSSRIWQYSLSTAYDISTASYDSVNLNLTAHNFAWGFTFNNDGSKVFVSIVDAGATGGRIAEYSLSTNYDLSTAGSQTLYVLSGTGWANYGIEFNNDGTKLFVNNNDDVPTKGPHVFTLSTAYDISTVSYTSTNADVNTLFGGSMGAGDITFNNNGSKMYISDTVNGYVRQFSVSTSTAFSASDVGKKVVGNSGSATITDASGTYKSVTAFADTSAISSWQLFGAQGKADGSGIELTGFEQPHTNVATPTHTKTYTWPSTYSKLGGIKISPDGTNFYASHYDSTAGLVHRFSLSTPYDITTATFTESGSFNLIRDFLWNSDGTKLYGLKYYTTVGIATKVASTPYSLTNMTDGTTITSTFATDAGGSHHMKGMCFSADKTQLYIANHGTNYFYQYSLDGDPGEIDSGLTYVGAAAVGMNNPHSLEMQADGTKLWFTTYLEGSASRYHYLPLSTPFDITSAGSRVQYNFPSPANAVGGNSRTPIFTFNEDQTVMYVSSTGNADATDNIFQFSVGTSAHPYSTYSPALTNSSNGQINSSSWLDINSMTADETKNGGDIFYAVSTDNRTSWGVAKASDGVRKIVKNNSGTWQYNNNTGSSTAVGFSLASPSYDNKSYSVSHSNPRGMYLKPDGTELYIGAYTGHVYQFTLSTPNDISTASSTGNYNIDEHNDTLALSFKPDGTKMYAADGTNMYQYTLSTAWDVTTASYDSVSYTPSDMGSSDIHSLNFNSDGTKLFMSDDGSSDNRIREYSLSTPYVISSASTTSNYLYHNKANVRGVDFSSDGTKIFLSSYSTQTVYQYNLASPYTLSSSQGTTADAEYDASSTISSGMYSMAFSNDGTKLFILESNTDTVKQFSTTTTALGYGTGETWVNGTNNNEHATLQQALTSQAFNRMDKAQLDAVADGYHFSQDSADTLDLMIAPYAASGASPVSDGVTINYDAESKYRQAVPETDYRVDFQGTVTVEFTSNISANFKVKVV